jgi:hypothetical protein
MLNVNKPSKRPLNSNFSSGPCAKRPGWTPDVLANALVGRSHRSAPGKKRIQEVIDNKLQFEYFDTDETIEGKTYTPEIDFKIEFDRLIIDVLKEDERTIEYPSLLLGKSNDFIRNNVIEYGRTNFDEISKFYIIQNRI